MNSSDIQVVKAEKSDLKGTLSLIKELAIYENAEDEVELSLAELEEDGFGKNPVYGLLVAKDKGEVIGIALYYLKYSTWKGKCIYLEDLVVREKYRKQGVGKKLFDKMISIAKELKVKRLEWQVLDWNKYAISFYKKYNAVLDDEWLNGKLTFEQIQSYKKQ